MKAFLDHAATTPMRPEAVAAMLPFLTERFGNPSGTHSVARSARLALEDARETIARHLDCKSGDVVFTASGTEADNLAVLGSGSKRPGDVVCSAVEHHAVLRPCEALGGVVVGVDASGTIDLDALEGSLHADVRLVSVMLANNEVGTLQPIPEVAALVRRTAPGAAFHTDAVAGVGWVDADVFSCADLVSVSAHKFGGPKGVGALIARDGVGLSPVLRGGEQERGRRPGTHNVAAIVGMAAALEAAEGQRETEAARVAALRDRLADAILATVPGSTEAGVRASVDGTQSHARKLPTSLNVRFEGVDSEELLVLLDDEGICASAGAACASGALEPSHVLRAMGLSALEARSAVRFSLGRTTSAEEIDYALEVVPKVVAQLRS